MITYSLKCCSRFFLSLQILTGIFYSSQLNSQEVESTRLVFQQGFEGYEGTFEKRVSFGGISELGADLTEYYLDGTSYFQDHVQNDTTELIRFDDIIGDETNQIPIGAFIISAKLSFKTGTDSNAVSDGPWLIGQLNEEVSQDTFYGDLTSDLDNPSKAGPRSIITDQLYAGYASITALELVSADVTAIVQNWVDGDLNHGFAIFANDTSNGWQIATIGNQEVSIRPSLEVIYTTEEVVVHEFKVTKSAIIKTGSPTIDGSTVATEFLDGADDVRDALLGFDGLFGSEEGQISELNCIVRADLIAHTAGAPDFSSNADSDDPYFIHQMLRDWESTSSIDPSGLTPESGQIGEAVDQFIGMGEFSRVTAEVTDIVKNWNSGQQNYGFNVKAGAGDGWQMFLGGAPSQDLLPTLRIVTIELDSTPQIDLTSSDLVGDAPLSVSFDASGSINSGGGELTYTWDFGDGTTSESGSKQNHTFENPGVYDVKLTAKNTDGISAEKIVTVKATGLPIVELSANSEMGALPLIVSFSAEGSRDSDGGVISYDWNFDNGESSSSKENEVIYYSEGLKNVKLTITDDEGVSSSATHQIIVYPSNVKALTFQQGLNGYEGTLQKRVSMGGVDENGADVAQYFLDGRPQTETQQENDTVDILVFNDLIGGEINQIPEGSKIVRAILTYHTGDNGFADSDGPWVIGKFFEKVDEDTTYEDLDLDQSTPEGRGPRSAVDSQLISGFSDIRILEVVSTDITPIVQAWIDGDPNYGVSVFTNDTTNGWQIKTIGNPDVSTRPKLTVFYLDNSDYTEYVFTPNLSSRISNVGDSTDGELLFYEYLDGGPDTKTEALIKFDDIIGEGDEKIGNSERILSAKLLILTGGVPDSSNNADSDDPYSVHQMLQDWDTTSQFGATGPTVSSGAIAPAVSSFLGLGERTLAQADVTPILYDWTKENPEQNYGFNIKPQGEDGWQILWPGAFDLDRGPRLIVLTEDALPFELPDPLEIDISGDNLIIKISFSGGRLQSAPNVDGPWSNVEGDSPYSESPSTDNKFYRVVR